MIKYLVNKLGETRFVEGLRTSRQRNKQDRIEYREESQRTEETSCHLDPSEGHPLKVRKTHEKEYIVENKTHKLLWDFEIQTDYLTLARRPDHVIANKKKKKRKTKRTSRIVD